jgi:xanthine/CO dehydrogenase XdhC/CoxF family maturation factor
VSILAEVLAVRAGASTTPLTDTTGAIHASLGASQAH